MSSASTASAVVLCTAGYDHTIRFWEAASGNCYRTIQYQDSQVNSMCITPDKQYLAVAGNTNVRLYEINTSLPNAAMTFDGHTANVTAVGFQKDRKWMFTGSEDGTLKIWDMRMSQAQRDIANKSPTKSATKSPINTVVLHPNQGELILGDEDGAIRVWDLTANKCSFELVPDGKTAVRSLTIASDASVVMAANNNGTVFSWKLESKTHGFEPLQRIEAHHTYCLKCVLSPDVKYLATCSADKTVKIWNAQQNLSLVQTLVGHQRWVWDCGFSADSAYLVTASSDSTSKLWDLASGDVFLEYSGHHTKALTSVALNDSSD